MNSGLYALAGDSATATLAACANRLDEPMTKVSNVYFGLSRLPSPPPLPARRSSRPVPGPTVARCAIGGGAGGARGGGGGGGGRGGPGARGGPGRGRGGGQAGGARGGGCPPR